MTARTIALAATPHKCDEMCAPIAHTRLVHDVKVG